MKVLAVAGDRPVSPAIREPGEDVGSIGAPGSGGWRTTGAGGELEKAGSQVGRVGVP